WDWNHSGNSRWNTQAAIKDISDTDQIGVDEIELELKPQAELLGLNLAQVMAQVRAGFFGEEIQRLQRGSDEVKVWVRYPKNSRRSIDQLMEMRINDGRGNNYLLSDIAIAKFNTATLAINRLEGKREIRVEANVANAMVSAPAVIGEIETQYIPKVLANYPSVSYSIEGQSRESAKLGATGAIVGPIVLLFIFALIILNFNSLYQAIIVFSLFPFALTGVILGHYLQAVPLNVFSFIGTIALIGVFVNNSLVFISTLNQHLKAGIEWKNALIETASSRFRPILLTTVTTVAGLAPLIASNSVGAQFLKGPAISISYGLVFGLLNILILLPALLHLFNGFRITAFNLFRKDKLSAEQVEPAVRSLRYQMNE
ncbi:MAG: efflux RND transporter permease subunit, partial [Bacteroidota bacterium]